MFDNQIDDDSIFKNTFTLSLNCEGLEDEYQLDKYNNKKLYSVAVFYVLLFVANIFVFFVFPNNFHLFILNFIEIFSLSFIILLNSSALVYIGLKNSHKIFLWKLISFLFILGIEIMMKNIRFWAMKTIDCETTNMVFIHSQTISKIEAFIHFFYFIFVDTNFKIKLICSVLYIVDYEVSLYYLNLNNYIDLMGTFFYTIIFILLVYFLEKRKKAFFVYNTIFKKTTENIQHLFDSINIGFMTFKDERVIQINNYLENVIGEKENLGKNSSMSQKMRKNVDLLTNHSKNYILSNLEFSIEFLEIKIKAGNVNVETKLNLFDSSDMNILKTRTLKENDFREILSIIKNNPNEFKEFKQIGTKLIVRENLDLIFQIYARYNKGEEQIEFFFNDISSVSKIENVKAQMKYKTLFLSKITHEFKNPLISIIELIEKINSEDTNFYNIEDKKINLLIAEDFNSNESTKKVHQGKLPRSETKIFYNKDLKENLINIQNLSRYMMILIKDFDFFTSAEMKKSFELNFEDVNLKEVCSFCVDIFRTRAELHSKNVEVSYEIPEEVPEIIQTDEVRLKQVLINLLSNSFKFTHSGGIFLTVNLSENPENKKKQIKFCVKDTGIGIPPDKLKILAVPFTKLENKNNIYGAGLGLTIAKDMVNSLNNYKNSLEIFSAPGEGTIITFNLPFEEGTRLNIQRTSSKMAGITHLKDRKIISYKTIKLKNHIEEIEPDNGAYFYPEEDTLTVRKKQTKTLQKHDLEIDESFKNHLYKADSTSPKSSHEVLKENEDDSQKEADLNDSLNLVDKSIEKAIPRSKTTCKMLKKDRLEDYKTTSFNINNTTLSFKKTSYNKLTPSTSNVFTQKLSTTSSKSAIKLMVVEDEVIIRKSHVRLLSDYFSQKGYECEITECSDGAECIYFLFDGIKNGIKYDAVITDESMYFISGSLLCNILNGLISGNTLNSLKLFIITSYETDNANMTSIKQKVTGIYNKPISKQIIDRIFRSFGNI